MRHGHGLGHSLFTFAQIGNHGIDAVIEENLENIISGALKSSHDDLLDAGRQFAGRKIRTFVRVDWIFKWNLVKRWMES